MVQIILIEKNGTIKQSNAKDLTKETIYKKCGLKNEYGFEKRTTWNTTIGIEKCIVELWSKDEGKAGTENKFELPEPIDKNLYFGTMAVVRVNSNGNIIDIKTDLWNKIYDKLMGDFDDIDEVEEDESEEDEEDTEPGLVATVSKSMKTKSGYLKDGFVVETNSEDEEDGGEGDEEDEEYEDDEDDEEDDDDDDEELDLEEDCSEGSELDEESYEYSDEDEGK